MLVSISNDAANAVLGALLLFTAIGLIAFDGYEKYHQIHENVVHVRVIVATLFMSVVGFAYSYLALMVVFKWIFGFQALTNSLLIIYYITHAFEKAAAGKKAKAAAKAVAPVTKQPSAAKVELAEVKV